jgi:hypothetical protein
MSLATDFTEYRPQILRISEDDLDTNGMNEKET